MTDRNDLNRNMARDYLQGARNFILAAETICVNTDENSGDWLFKLENPVTFLLGHASELILKAGLAKRDILTGFEHSHELSRLVEKSQENGIPLNPDFCYHVKIINDNFENHDHRYQRSFSVFPEYQHDKLMEKIIENTPQARKELKKYGLVVKSIPNFNLFLKAIQSQLQMAVDWINPVSDKR